MSHHPHPHPHQRRPRDPHAAVPERDFLHGHWLLHGVTHADPKRLRELMLGILDEAFPFHPALPERILLRLGALSAMWRHPIMESWKTAPTAAALGETALRVAATHPLCGGGWFVPESFLGEMLRRMSDEGRA